MEEKESATLKKILEVAEKEFLKNGFKNASLRNIVKKAGVTTGAFYGYFKSKDELFDALVGEEADHMKKIYDDILEDFLSLPFDEQVKKIEDFSSTGLNQMFEYGWDHKGAFRLILNCGAGTRHEHFIKEIVKKDIESTDYFYGALKNQGMQVMRVNPMTEKIITDGTFASFFALLLSDVSKDEAYEILNQLFRFYRGGWARLTQYAK